MSQPNAQDMPQRLQNIQECLDVMLFVYKDESKEHNYRQLTMLYQLVERWKTLPIEEIDSQHLAVIEAFMIGSNTIKSEASTEGDILHKQGTASCEKFERWGNLPDLEQAITSWQRAVALTSDRGVNMPVYLNNLGNALQTRFEQLGTLADLDDAISRIREALDLASDGHPYKPGILSNLGKALQRRFDQQGSQTDLEEAISLTRKAVELLPDGHSSKPASLYILGGTLQTRFSRHGSLEDLEDAILQHQKAIDLAPENHPHIAGYLHGLGIALGKRFYQHFSPLDLEGAILQTRKAVELTPDGHPDKPVYLGSLGGALAARLDRYGSESDLQETISQLRKALDLTPNGHPNESICLGALGSLLERRFDRYGSLEDLEDAISQTRKAVELLPDVHPNKPFYLSSLGAALHTRFERYRSLTHLEDAISQHRKAVDLTPVGNPYKPARLGNLGNALSARSSRIDSLTDLEDALLQVQTAVDLTPENHPNKPMFLNNLGHIFKKKFQRDQAPSDLDASILHARMATLLAPNGDPDGALYLQNLSRVLKIRFECLGDQTDLQGALSASRESAESPVASSRLRLAGAQLWAHCCRSGSTSSFQAFECAIDILPHVAWLGLGVDDQYFLLAEAGPTVRYAVEAAIEEGEYAMAIEWAEQGRSIVWQNLLSLRTPLDRVHSEYPDLATRLQELSRLLQRRADARNALDGSKLSGIVSDVTRLVTERDRLIDEIRSKPGHATFMKRKSFEQLAPAVQDGAIVILNLGNSRCDALAFLSDNCGVPQVIPIPLERVTVEGAQRLLEQLVWTLGDRTSEPRKPDIVGKVEDKDSAFKEILGTLWLDYVKPIVDALAYSVNLDSPPRLWWCTTGPLAFLPLHAAGLYDSDGVGHKVSDYVVSSYAPTLAALFDPSSSSVHEDAKILTVAMSETPGAKPLPKTDGEVERVQHLAGNLPIVSLRNVEATKESVLRGLEQSNWAHLACHGKQVGGKPMESGLLLQDGMLELSEIIKIQKLNAEFVFLSACETAVGDGGVPEESAHLAAGMLFAGYRGVVATMWSIQDAIAPRVAEDFYRYMFRNGQPKAAEAAYALHRAIRSLQESGVPFTSWVPFIHVGR